jgi:hypothetical protein
MALRYFGDAFEDGVVGAEVAVGWDMLRGDVSRDHRR